MGMNMGMGKLGNSDLCMMRKFRWLFFIDGVCDDGANALPPDKGARPSLSFKEIEVQHINEIVYFPGKPDWKPIQLTLFDLKMDNNPVFEWLASIYDVCGGDDDEAEVSVWNAGKGNFKKNGKLRMFDGCGNIMEEWIFKNMWPNNIEWGELDMGNMDYVTVELMLRYDRAWVKDCRSSNPPSPSDPFMGDIDGSRMQGQV